MGSGGGTGGEFDAAEHAREFPVFGAVYCCCYPFSPPSD